MFFHHLGVRPPSPEIRFCRWGFACTRSFCCRKELLQHNLSEHVPTAVPVYRHELPMLLRTAEGIGESYETEHFLSSVPRSAKGEGSSQGGKNYSQGRCSHLFSAMVYADSLHFRKIPDQRLLSLLHLSLYPHVPEDVQTMNIQYFRDPNRLVAKLRSPHLCSTKIWITVTSWPNPLISYCLTLLSHQALDLLPSMHQPGRRDQAPYLRHLHSLISSQVAHRKVLQNLSHPYQAVF